MFLVTHLDLPFMIHPLLCLVEKKNTPKTTQADAKT
jgi:hypothetical protein